MYIALEGIDTTGKSTQIDLLRNIYKNAIFTKEPSDSVFGNKIRDLALHLNLSNTTQAFLFLADRANHTQEILLPNKDKLIISDRSLISGIAYAKDLDFELLVKMNLEASLPPNLVIILQSNEVILKKRLSNKENDNIEKNGIEYLLNIQDRILHTTKMLEVEHICIDCSLDKFEILKTITSKIDSLL
ncbi:MAG: dTMP kinase [Helicobacteraceae bacterium]|nr:dTMP kinase [Helicobacteraceae bacterium]